MVTIKLEVSVMEAEMYHFGLKRVYKELNDAAGKDSSSAKECVNHSASLYEDQAKKLKAEITKQIKAQEEGEQL